MKHLPIEVRSLLEQTLRELKVIFKIASDGGALFVHVNKEFVDFHVDLGLEITESDILGIHLEDYFKFHLGFTEDQIKPRIEGLHEAVRNGSPYPFNEVSHHPGVVAMELDSVYHPVFTDNVNYVIWESRLILRTDL